MSYIHRLGLTLAAALVAVTAAQAGDPVRQGPQRPPLPSLSLPGDASGEDAIRALGDSLPEVAAHYGMSPERLAELLRSDPSLRIDDRGRLYYVDPAAPARLREAPRGSIPAAGVFSLHTDPGADKVIYLDFDGHHSVNNDWGHDIVFPPYDLDDDPSTFTSDELAEIAAIWTFVAEDYAPFLVDVTTEDPGLDAIIYSGGPDVQFGIRCLMTQPTGGFGNGIGGVAFIGSFGDPIDNPVFVFNKGDNVGSMTASHEVGHALELFHDGLFGQEYHPGTGSGETSWGPIMGAPFSSNLVQWSNGDYEGATNTQDDIAIISSPGNGISFRADDHGNSIGSATPLPEGCDDPTLGLVHHRFDLDFFSFDTVQGEVTVAASPAVLRPNIDILLDLYDSDGTLIDSDNPVDGISATITVTLPAGEYFVLIDGVGKDGVYSDYGSIGQYTLEVSIPGGSPAAGPDCDGNGISDACDIANDPGLDADGTGILDSCEAIGDNNGDGVVSTADLLALLGAWGPCPAPCPQDTNGDGVVSTVDLLTLLGNWG